MVRLFTLPNFQLKSTSLTTEVFTMTQILIIGAFTVSLIPSCDD